MRYSLTTISVETDEETGATTVAAVDQPEHTVLVAYNIESLEGLLVVYDIRPPAFMEPSESGDDDEANPLPHDHRICTPWRDCWTSWRLRWRAGRGIYCVYVLQQLR